MNEIFTYAHFLRNIYSNLKTAEEFFNKLIFFRISDKFLLLINEFLMIPYVQICEKQNKRNLF